MTRRGKIFTAIGLLLLLAALCLTAYNLMTDAMASMQVQVTLEALKPELEEEFHACIGDRVSRYMKV